MRLISTEIKNIPQLFSFLNTIYTEPSRYLPRTLNIGFLIPEIDLNDEKFLRVIKNKGLTFNAERRHKNLYFVYLGKKSPELYYMIANRDYWLFITDAEGNRAKNSLKTFIRNSKPFLNPVIFFQEDLLNILDRLSSKCVVQFLEGTYKSEFRARRNWEKRKIEYKREYLEELAKKENFRWSSIAVLCKWFDHDGLEKHIKFRIYDDGWVNLYYGHFSFLFEEVILPLLNIALSRRNMLKEVESAKFELFKKLKTVVLKAQNDLSQNQIASLKAEALRHYIGTVIEEGNPYLYLELIDREDYSSMSLFAYKNVIEIVPVRNPSAAALADLVSLITDVLPSAVLSTK